jgi:steroid delta-isomerase
VNANDTRAALQRLRRYYEGLDPAALAQLDQFYAADARFSDPFQSVQGLAAIRAVFEHMYRSLDGPRFIVHELVADAGQGFMSWEFRFRLRPGAPELCVQGGTHFKFAADGRVTLHQDYWDAAGQLYVHLPLIGTLMRWLRRRMAGG